MNLRKAVCLLTAALVLLCLFPNAAATELTVLPGDIDGNRSVSQEDVVYLLLHTMFGEKAYPLNGAPGDIDGSGAIGERDVVYLLLHTMFGGERYPLLATLASRNPLNGQLLASPWEGRATAVVLNNHRQCLPQHGISDADVVFEMETEGGITRLLAIFSDVEGIEAIGPIRSARTFLNNLAVAYGATLIHCGGSKEGKLGHYASNGEAIENWAHLDELYNTQYFFRDQNRLSSGYSSEHTLFTSGQLLLQSFSEKGLSAPNSQSTNYGLSFGFGPTGEAAGSVTVTFSGGKTTTMEYNSETGKYGFYQYGFLQTDGNTQEAVTFSNVLLLKTKHWMGPSATDLRSFYDLIGSGSGYCATGGQLIAIRWSRETLEGPLTFTLEDGTPLKLSPGSTYIAFSGNADYISWQ